MILATPKRYLAVTATAAAVAGVVSLPLALKGASHASHSRSERIAYSAPGSEAPIVIDSTINETFSPKGRSQAPEPSERAWEAVSGQSSIPPDVNSEFGLLTQPITAPTAEQGQTQY